MEKHFELSDTDFEDQFANCELDPALFSHEAHLRLAWIHITNYGVEKAEDHIHRQITHYVTHLGAADKYNKTLTIAAVKIVDHFIRKSKSENFLDFIEEFPRLKNDFKSLVDSHYSFDIFRSERAKKEYLQPDLLAFDTVS